MKSYIAVFNRFVIVNIIQLLQFFLIAKYFSIVENGKIAVLLTASFLISNLVMLGIPSAIVYFGSKKNVSSVMRIAFNHIKVLFIFLLLSLLVLFNLVDDYYYISIAILSFTNVLYLVSQSFFQMKEYFKLQNAVILLQSLSTFLSFVLCIKFNFKIDYFYFLVLVNVVTATISIMIVFMYSVDNSDANSRDCKILVFYKYSIGVYFNSLLSIINGRLDVLIIGAILGSYYTGLYSFIVQITERLSIFSQVATTILFPKLSKENCMKKVFKLTENSLFGIFVLTLVSIFIFSWAIPYLNESFFLSKYDEAIPFLKFSLLAVFFNSMSRLIYTTFSSLGLIKLNLKLGCWISLLTLTFFPSFCYLYGLSGALISLMITAAISLFLSILFLTKLKKDQYGKHYIN